MPRQQRALTQVLAIQQTAFSAIQTLDADLSDTQDKLLRTRIAAGISQLGKTFQAMEDTKRILRGKPLPGSLRPMPKVRRTPHAKLAPIEAPHEPKSIKDAPLIDAKPVQESPFLEGTTGPDPTMERE